MGKCVIRFFGDRESSGLLAFQVDVVGHGCGGSGGVLGDDVGAVAEEIDQGSCVDFLGQVPQRGVAGPLGVDAEDFEPAGESVRVQVPARTGAREQPRGCRC